MKLYLIGFAILLLTMAVAIANSQGTTNISEKNEEYLNPGEPIKVKASQIFAIRMESNPTTGNGWQMLKALDNKIILVTNAYIPPDSNLMGAGGHEVWAFKAIGEGQADISMQYVRPWEKDQPVRTNVFTVIVK